MAKVELNIVALGDFSSVNAQIKSLQEQVVLLQKNMAGVGVSSNFAKELSNINASFKQTMLSTGQFTESTVMMTSETDKFGQALVTGKLKLTEYYNIIKQKNSEAVTQMKALAVEQTKLQNSVVMNDPSKQGILSVYTPTQIDKVANATKIAANEANLYALAVKKGSQELINWGKNTQWAGRQLTVGMSVPLMIFGQEAVKSFKDVNTELTRLQRLYGEGLTPPSQTELNQISSQVLNLGKQIAGTMGIAQTETVKAAANFAAMGRQGQDLLTTTAETMRLSKLGAVSTADATNTVVALQNVYKVSTYNLADAVNFLSDIQKQTTMTLGDMTQAIPRVGPIMQQLGGTYKDTAVMLVAMREAGIPAAQAANAVKSAVASMIAPTSAASKEFMQYGINLTAIKDSTQGNPVKMIEALQAGMAKLSPLVKEQLIEKLFGKFQFARVSALLDNFGKIGSQTQNALKIAGATSGELATLANQEMKQATESPTARYQRALESFKATLYPVGQELIKIATKLMDFGNAIGKVFSGLPGPLKSVMGAIAIGIALSGPIIMLTGLFANFAGYVLKGFFNLKQLATGGKTLGQLLTPELIAAQNANQLFATGIAGDVDAVNLLSKAIQDLTLNIQTMVDTLSKGTGFGAVLTDVANSARVYEQMKLPGFATGGIVPGSGSGKVDTYPAMLAPGELVVDADTTKKYWPLFNAAINGKIPKYAEGNVDQFKYVYYSPTTGDKQYSAPKAIQGGASALIGEDFPKIVRITQNVIEEFGLLDSALIKNKNAQQVYNQYTQMDLGHLSHPEKLPGQGKPWMPSELAGVTHPENQTLEQIAGPALKPYVDKTVSDLLNGTIKTGLSKEKIEEAARSIRLGEQPIDDAALEVYTRILQAIRTDVKSGKVKIGTSPGTISNALVAEATMTARVFPEETAARGYETIAKPKLLSSITPKFLSDFRKQKKAYLDELKQAAAEARVEGENLATGYFAGIESRMTEAQAVASGFTNATINAVKRTQKSASPSKVAEQLGLDFGEGYAQGVKQADVLASEAGGQLVNSATLGVEEQNLSSGNLLSKITSKIPFMGGSSGSMSSLAKFGLSSGIMMGGQMLSSMLPKGGVAADLASGASSGASLGMFMGPEGAAIGAAVGAAISGIKELMKAESDHAKQAAATFQSSADAAQLFGGTVSSQAKPLVILGSTANSINPPLSQLTTNMNNIKDAIKNLPKDNALVLVVNAMTAANATNAASIAKSFVTTQMAINGIDPEKAKQLYDALNGVAGKPQAIGAKSGLPTSTESAVVAYMPTEARAGNAGTNAFANDLGYAAAYGKTNAAWQQATTQVKTLFETIMTLDTHSKQYADTIKGLNDKSINNQSALSILSDAYSTSDKALSDQITKLAMHGATFAQVAQLFKDAGQQGSKIPTQIIDEMKKSAANIPASDWAALVKEIASYVAPSTSGGTPPASGSNLDTGSSTVFSGTTQQKQYKKLLEARVKDENVITKGLNDQLKAYKLQVEEAKRLRDYDLQRADILSQRQDALITGNFMQAAILGQQSAGLAIDFNATSKENLLQGTIDSIQTRADQFSTALADLNDVIANGSSKIDDTIKKVAGLSRVAANSEGTGTITVQNNITISSLESPQQIASAVAKQAQAGTLAGVAAAKAKKTNQVIVGGK